MELLKDTPLYTDEYSERSGDFMSLPRSSRPPVLKAMPGARTLSSLVWRESRYVKSFERVAPAATVYRNRLGGTVAVMSYNFGLGVSYLYSEARQRFVYDVLDAVNGGMFENICVNAQNVMTLARRADDGADLILVQNLNYDTDSAVMLRRRNRPASVEMMGADGHWRECAFSWNDGTVVLPVEWPCYGVKMLRIR